MDSLREAQAARLASAKLAPLQMTRRLFIAVALAHFHTPSGTLADFLVTFGTTGVPGRYSATRSFAFAGSHGPPGGLKENAKLVQWFLQQQCELFKFFQLLDPTAVLFSRKSNLLWQNQRWRDNKDSETPWKCWCFVRELSQLRTEASHGGTLTGETILQMIRCIMLASIMQTTNLMRGITTSALAWMVRVCPTERALEEDRAEYSRSQPSSLLFPSPKSLSLFTGPSLTLRCQRRLRTSGVFARRIRLGDRTCDAIGSAADISHCWRLAGG